MTLDQSTIVAILGVAMVLFVWGRWRYDVVAVLALMAVVLTGIVPPGDAFLGFSSPAVITVAAVLALSRSLKDSGVIAILARPLGRLSERPLLFVPALTGVVAAASSLMNNVGALALLMPVALVTARRLGHSPAEVLMPMAFGSILGGMTTMIGTPPNIIVASYRSEISGAPFHMFDFTPVGLAVAVCGVLFVTLVGWRLIPKSRRSAPAPEHLFSIEEYITEAHVEEDTPYVGRSVGELAELGEGDVVVAAHIRGGRRRLAPSRRLKLQAGDVLILEGDPTAVKPVVDGARLSLPGGDHPELDSLRSDEVKLMEVVVAPGSALEGRTPRALSARAGSAINLLGLARRGRAVRHRLGRQRFRPGDVLLLQGDGEELAAAVADLGCLPLQERPLQLGRPRQVVLPLTVFAAALALAALGVLPAPIAFTLAVAVLVIGERLTLRSLYDSIDWPVIILLGAMIPVGRGLEATGTTELVAGAVVSLAGAFPDWGVLAVVLVATMMLSDVVNNAATAVIMGPIAVAVAQQMGVHTDPFLMAVAVGASCAFLTPIGHQSNTLVMGPGGYAFGDYWRLGLPLEILIVIIAVPLLMIVWPL